MADRYWVGGTDTWNATAGLKWSTTSGGAGGASVPNNGDNVFFDANSGVGTITLGATLSVKNFDTTGFTGTFASGGSFNLRVWGHLTLGAGTQGFTNLNGLTLDAADDNGGLGYNITLNGIAPPNTTFGSAGKWVLQSAWSTTKAITFTQGHLVTNGYSVTCLTFSSNNSNVRTLDLGTSTLTLTSVSASAILVNFATNTNMTLIADQATIVVATHSNTTRTVNIGVGGVVGTLDLPGNGVTSQVIRLRSGTFGTINYVSGNADANNTLQINAGDTVNVGTFNIRGFSATDLLNVTSHAAGSSTALVKTGGGVVDTDWLSIRDVAASPADTWYADESTNVSGNTGWTFGPAPSGTASVVGASVLPALTQSGVVALQVPAAGASTLPALAQAATVEVRVPAAGASTLPTLTQAATAASKVAVASDSTLPALTQAGEVRLVVPAIAEQVLPALVSNGTLGTPSTIPPRDLVFVLGGATRDGMVVGSANSSVGVGAGAMSEFEAGAPELALAVSGPMMDG